MKLNKSRYILFLIILILTLPVSSFSDPFVDGFFAAELGEYDKAVMHWGPLASEGHAIAQFNIALMYHSGSGLPFNEQEAMAWYKKSAANGYHKAQEYLAAGYAYGWFGLKQNSNRATYWENMALKNTPYFIFESALAE